MTTRLPTHVEIGAILRLAQAEGGFGTIIAKGEADAGTILIVTMERGNNTTLWERLPSLDEERLFSVTRTQDAEKPNEFFEYLDRRRSQDPDLWVIEVDLADAGAFIRSKVNRVDS